MKNQNDTNIKKQTTKKKNTQQKNREPLTGGMLRQFNNSREKRIYFNIIEILNYIELLNQFVFVVVVLFNLFFC